MIDTRAVTSWQGTIPIPNRAITFQILIKTTACFELHSEKYITTSYNRFTKYYYVCVIKCILSSGETIVNSIHYEQMGKTLHINYNTQ